MATIPRIIVFRGHATITLIVINLYSIIDVRIKLEIALSRLGKLRRAIDVVRRHMCELACLVEDDRESSVIDWLPLLQCDCPNGFGKHW